MNPHFWCSTILWDSCFYETHIGDTAINCRAALFPRRFPGVSANDHAFCLSLVAVLDKDRIACWRNSVTRQGCILQRSGRKRDVLYDSLVLHENRDAIQ